MIKRFLGIFATIFIFGCVASVPSTDKLSVDNLNIKKEPQIAESKKISIEKLSKVKLPFIENQGQINSEVKFYANTFAGTVYVTDDELVYNLPFAGAKGDKNKEEKEDKNKAIENLPTKGVTLRERFVNPKTDKFTPQGEKKSEAVFSSFIGNDKSKWISGSATYDSVKVGEPWEGIKLELHAYGNNVEKLFTVAPGISPDNIAVAFEGAKDFKVDSTTGELVVNTGLGDIKFTKPIAYQLKDGKKEEVKVAYISKEEGYGFEIGSYDNNAPLIIDPLLASTFIGGANNEYAYSISIDSSGNVFVAGVADTGYPTTSGAYDQTQNNNSDAFISKLNSSLTTLLASTFIGGTNNDFISSMAIDSSGNVFVAGDSNSSNYPTTAGAYDQTHNPGVSYDVFISKLNSSLTSLSASTWVGATSNNFDIFLAIDSSGDIFIAGDTGSSGYPTTAGAYDETHNGSGDVFVSKLNSSLTTLAASTFIGGSSSELCKSLAIDSSGNVFVAGSASSGYPTTSGAYDQTHNGNTDVFVSKLNSTLTSLSASTFIGGSGSEIGKSLAIDSSGNVFVAGSASSGYPTTSGAYDQTHNGSEDVFISKLNSSLTTLTASTFIGGSSSDICQSLAIDSSGNVFVAGYTPGSDYPTTSGAYDQTQNGSDDVFVSKLNSSLTLLNASTFIGGSGSDIGYSSTMAFDTSGNVYFAGYAATGYPITTGAYDETHNGSNDVFVSKFDSSLSPADTTPPTVTSVTSSTANGSYKTGGTVSIQVVFDEVVTVTGTPRLTLETGSSDAVVDYASGSGSNTLTFTYTVASGHSSSDLDYASTGALALNSGTIQDAALNNATLTLASPGASGSLGNNKALVVDTTSPTVAITSSASSPTSTSPILVTIIFSESVTGFVVGDITVGNGSAGNFAGSGTTYTTDITPSAQGAVTVDVSSSVATDTAENSNSAATQFSITYDSQVSAPTITSTSGASTAYINTIQGNADSNATVEVFNNSVSLGTATANSEGLWTLSLLTAVAAGPHSLTAVATDGAGNESDPSEVVPITVLSTVLDFDNDGISDVSLYKKTKNHLLMQITNSSDSSVNIVDVDKAYAHPAVGDYNGNGKAEVAVLSRGAKNVLNWSFVDEDTESLTTESFGKYSDYVITGCNFDSSVETEMAYLRGNSLYFKHHSHSEVTKINLPSGYRSNAIRGCGDLDNDGVSELLFETKEGTRKNRIYDFVAIDLNGNIVKQLDNVENFRLAYVEDAVGDETSDLLFKVDRPSNGSRTLDIWDGSSDENTSDVTVGTEDNFSIGISKNSDNDYLSCLIYAGDSGAVSKKYLKSGDTVSTGVTLGAYRFATPVNVYKLSLESLK